jgi:serine/threonine protein kinase
MLLTLDESGEPCIKVTDFGYARVCDRSITADGIVVGTSSYMAPEQVLCEPVDARTDVYALGVSLFFALTGELPFESDKRARALAHQVFSKPPPPSWLVDGLAPCVDDIVATATRKDPASRYPTMTALSEDIDAALSASKLRRAGASRVVSPFLIAGRRMANMLTRPATIDFLDTAIQRSGAELQLEEVMVREKSDFTGHTLAEAQIRQRSGAMVLAVRQVNGETMFNPGADTELRAGQMLIAIGTRDQLEKLRKVL